MQPTPSASVGPVWTEDARQPQQMHLKQTCASKPAPDQLPGVPVRPGFWTPRRTHSSLRTSRPADDTLPSHSVSDGERE